MAKTVNYMKHSLSNSDLPTANLVIDCPCGEQHVFCLNSLPSTTAERSQLECECEYAKHLLVHSGEPHYRKILLISEMEDK